jgi:hypothetical protein
MTGGQRRCQTFDACGEEHDMDQIVMSRNKRQPGLAELPFTFDTFKDICNTFRVHKSFAKAVTRTDVPSFQCEKVDMKEPAYGTPVHLRHEYYQMLTRLVYNCRTSNSWPSDMALSATHLRSSGMTCAVMYGCTQSIEQSLLRRLAGLEHRACHPMIMPGIFAEMELLRHVGLVEATIVDIETKIFRLDFGANGIEAIDRKEMNKRNIQKREAWLDASYLKNSLVTWNVQITKMASHAEEISSGLRSIQRRPEVKGGQEASSDTSTSSSQTWTKDDESDGEEWYRCGEDAQKPANDSPAAGGPKNPLVLNNMADAAEKIKSRLATIHDEYEEKIRDCNMRIDGMAMATQWVRTANTHIWAQG